MYTHSRPTDLDPPVRLSHTAARAQLNIEPGRTGDRHEGKGSESQ